MRRFGTAVGIAAALTAALACALPEVAKAGPDNAEVVAQGKRWLRICTSERRVDEAMCAGFIMGMEETQFLPENKNQYCPPPMFSVEDEKKVIVKFLQKNPGRLGERFSRLAVDAMKEAFPCR